MMDLLHEYIFVRINKIDCECFFLIFMKSYFRQDGLLCYISHRWLQWFKVFVDYLTQKTYNLYNLLHIEYCYCWHIICTWHDHTISLNWIYSRKKVTITLIRYESSAVYKIIRPNKHHDATKISIQYGHSMP